MHSLLINRSDFKKALDLCEKVVPAKGARACLKSVKVDYEKNRLTVAATDLEAYVVVSLEAECTEKGSVLLPCSTVKQIVAESDVEKLEIQLGDTIAKVCIGFDEFEIPTMPIDEFPDLPTIPKSKDVIKADSMALKKALYRALIVAPSATDQSRHSFTGVRLRLKAEKILHVVAIAGSHFVSSNVECDAKTEALEYYNSTTRAILLPNEFAKLLHDCCGEWESTAAPIELIRTGNKIIARTGNVLMQSLLVEGHCPNYERVIESAGCDKELVVKVSDLQKAMRKAQIMANAETSGVRFNFTQAKITISSADEKKGKGRIEIECEFSDETPLENIMKYDIVQDGVKMYDEGEKAMLELKNPTSPVIWRHKDFVFMLSPITGK